MLFFYFCRFVFLFFCLSLAPIVFGVVYSPGFVMQ